jgi:CubicO group peptidase (beta-lactamase class C family)
MNAIPLAKPDEIGIDPARWQRVCALLEKWAAEDKVPAAGLCVGRRGRMLEPLLVGRQRPGPDAPAIRPDVLFLVASITKPVTASAVMMLVERGAISLEDRVAAYVPRFAANGKEDVQIRHLLTHTSGLPDMTRDNEKLRQGHKPLAAFIDAICQEHLLFPPGTKVSYQSTGRDRPPGHRCDACGVPA